jgi:hypothetical protein
MSALHQSCNRSNHGSRRAGRIRARREIGFPSPPQAGCPKLRCSLTRIVVSKYTKEELAGERQDVGFEPPEGGQPDLAGRWCSTASGAAAPPYRSCQPLRAFAFSASPRSNVSDSLRRPSHDDFEGIGCWMSSQGHSGGAPPPAEQQLRPTDLANLCAPLRSPRLRVQMSAIPCAVPPTMILRESGVG